MNTARIELRLQCCSLGALLRIHYTLIICKCQEKIIINLIFKK